MRVGSPLFSTLLFSSAGPRQPAVCFRRHIHPWLLAERAHAATAEPEVSTLGDLPDFRGPSRLLKDAYKKSQLVQPEHEAGESEETCHQICDAEDRCVRLGPLHGAA